VLLAGGEPGWQEALAEAQALYEQKGNVVAGARVRSVLAELVPGA
jgi:hypothetical protein